MRRGGQTYYYAQDFAGNVTGLLSSTGGVTNQYRYGVWGAAELTVEGVPNSLRFAARQYDAETGLYYNRARYYDPAVGRFISEDPLGLAAGINLYAGWRTRTNDQLRCGRRLPNCRQSSGNG